MATTDIIKRIRFEPIAGPPTEAIVMLSSKPWVIGRQSTADSVLNDNSVSRRHAFVTHKADTWLLSDLESRHGTFVNGIKLGPGESSPIHDGDLVRIGPWTFRVGGPTHGTRVSASDGPVSFADLLDIGRAIIAEQVRDNTHCAARIGNVDRLIALIVRADFYRCMHLACRRAADQQWHIKPLPLHFRSDEHHFVEAWGDQP